jgi:alcohol dehydrogenase
MSTSLPVELPAIRLLPGAAPALLSTLATESAWCRAAIICSPRFAETTEAKAIAGAFPGDARVFAVVASHAPISAVEDAVQAVSPYGPDVLISLGGGSAHDTTKGLAVLLAMGGPLLRHCLSYVPPDDLQHRALSGPKLPIVTVPTTLAGSEANGAAGFTPIEEPRKRVLSDRSITPQAVLIDSALLRSTPRDIMHGSAMNALNHCVEGLASRRRNLLAQSLLSTALLELSFASQDLDSAADAQWERLGTASALAGLGLTGSWLGLGHALGHVIGARYRVPHGYCHAVLAGAAVRFNASVAGDRHADAAGLLGLAPSSEALAQWLDDRAASWNLPRRLRDLGARETDLPALAEMAWRDHDTYYNARRVESPRQVLALLQESF